MRTEDQKTFDLASSCVELDCDIWCSDIWIELYGHTPKLAVVEEVLSITLTEDHNHLSK